MRINTMRSSDHSYTYLVNDIVLSENRIDTIRYIGTFVTTTQYSEIYQNLTQDPIVVDEMARDRDICTIVRRCPEIDGQGDLGLDRLKIFLQKKDKYNG